MNTDERPIWMQWPDNVHDCVVCGASVVGWKMGMHLSWHQMLDKVNPQIKAVTEVS